MAALDRALRWIRRLPPLAIDSALAGAILLAGIVDLAVLTHRSSFPPGVPVRFGTLPYLLMTLWVGSLAFRRMNLAAVFAISVGTTIIGLVHDAVPDFRCSRSVICLSICPDRNREFSPQDVAAVRPRLKHRLILLM